MANNRTLNVVVMPYWPYVYKAAEHPEGHNQNEQRAIIDGWSGIGIDLLAYISKQVGIEQLNIQSPPDGQWGELQNGTFNGMCGVVLRGEAHVGLAHLDLNAERVPHFEALRLPFVNSKTIWIHKKSLERPARHAWTLVRLLDTETWLLALLCLLSAICVLRLVRHTLQLPQLPTFELRVFGSVLGQLDYGTNSVAEQFVYASLLLSMMLFCICFSTSLIAEFTVDEQKLPFTTTKEMYEKGYRIAHVAESISDLHLFRDSPNPWERALFDNRPNENEFYLNATFFAGAFQNYSADNHVMKTGAKYGLLLGEVPLSDAATGCNHPWIPAVVDAFTNPFALMIFAKQSRALFHQFDSYYTDWVMHGLVRAAHSRAEQGSPRANALRCSHAQFVSKDWQRKLKSPDSGRQAMALETFQSPLILLTAGGSAAALVFCGELLYAKRSKTKTISPETAKTPIDIRKALEHIVKLPELTG